MKKEDNKEKITKEMTFAEIMQKNPEVIGILMEKGMHCCGCHMAQMESLEQGCMIHGLDVDEVVKEINKK